MLNLRRIPYDLRNAGPCRGGSIERLRSATFITDGLSLEERRLFLEECTSWIGKFNDWFFRTIGVPEGKGFHLLYDRDISVTGEMLLDSMAEIELLGKTARGYGFSFSLSLTSRHLLERLDDFLFLANNKILSAVLVSIDHEQNDFICQKNICALEAIVDCGLNVAILGDIVSLRQNGLFSAKKLSSADMTWYPYSDQETHPKSPNSVRACYSKLRLYISSYGDIYPCFGLIGLSNGILGNIREPIESTGLGEAPVLDLLDLWERNGPQIDDVPEIINDDDISLPEICRQHRWSLS